jgi:Ca2+-binding RTX toxin-like protein
VATINGTEASETLNGTDGDDEIHGAGGDDTINGNGGNDILEGGDGTDVIHGGEGNDTFYSSNGNFDPEQGYEILAGDGGDDTFYVSYVFNNFDVQGGDGYDTLYLNADIIYSEETSDGFFFQEGMTFRVLASGFEKIVINGAGQSFDFSNATGVDFVISYADFVSTGDGNDIIAGNHVSGGAGNDVLSGYDLSGGAGDDIYIVSTADTIVYDDGGGTDTVRSTVSFNLPDNVENLELLGTSAINGHGNDLNNVLTGNDAANILNGEGGADTMIGGLGDDVYTVDNAGDVVIDSSMTGGFDTIRSSVSYALPGHVEKLVLTGTSAIDGTGNGLGNTILGNSAANVLNGGGGADTLVGYDGNDTLLGGAYNDNLNGANGDDVLSGGAGNDLLQGGAGSDQFLFDAALSRSSNVDQIYDFSVPADTVALDDDVFSAAGAPGALSADAFYAGAAAHDASDRIIYNSSNGNLYYDADGSGPTAAILFAHVAEGTPLTSADFVIVA